MRKNEYGNHPVPAAEVVECPTCKAEAGAKCVSVWKLNEIDSTHNKRYLAAVAAKRIAPIDFAALSGPLASGSPEAK